MIPRFSKLPGAIWDFLARWLGQMCFAHRLTWWPCGKWIRGYTTEDRQKIHRWGPHPCVIKKRGRDSQEECFRENDAKMGTWKRDRRETAVGFWLWLLGDCSTIVLLLLNLECNNSSHMLWADRGSDTELSRGNQGTEKQSLAHGHIVCVWENQIWTQVSSGPHLVQATYSKSAPQQLRTSFLQQPFQIGILPECAQTGDHGWEL